MKRSSVKRYLTLSLASFAASVMSTSICFHRRSSSASRCCSPPPVAAALAAAPAPTPAPALPAAPPLGMGEEEEEEGPAWVEGWGKETAEAPEEAEAEEDERRAMTWLTSLRRSCSVTLVRRCMLLAVYVCVYEGTGM